MKEIQAALNGNIITVVVLALVVVGGVKSINGDLSFQEFVDTVTAVVVGTAVGRGLAAYRTTK